MVSVGQDAGIEEGIIVGYGQSEDKSKTHETIPRVLKVPIKDNEECFLDNYKFAKIGSKRTFCAGSKNGTGACRGDSGSGLFIKIGATHYLRGIVSSSLFDENGYCDVDNYAIYTNIPQFLRWIQNPSDPSSLLAIPDVVQSKPQSQDPINQQRCGAMVETSSLIQGGKRSSVETFPWTVAIFVRQDLDLYEHKAVGTLISSKHLVSLGNPFAYINERGVLMSIDTNRLKMYFGINSFSESSVSGGLILDGALKIIIHPDFKHEIPRSSDIAIIFIQSPILLTNTISPACLWSFKNDFDDIVGKIGYAVGWGIDEEGIYSEHKKHAALKIQDRNTCHQFYPEYVREDRYFCAASANRQATSCEYDDPFYMKVNGKWFLRALVNVYFFRSDENKCSSDTPVLYEDVAVYSKWIHLQIQS